jgi:hypothetical protein
MEGSMGQPEELPWLAKAGAVPVLPRPTEDWPEQLVRLLSHLVAVGPQPRDQAFQNAGSDTTYTLEQYGNQLAPFGLLARGGDKTVGIGEFGREWLANRTPEALLRQLHSRARFVGELLQALVDRPKGIVELLDTANEEYELDWKSYDQVRRRLTWLITLGFADRHFDNHYVITDAGRAILPTLALHAPGLHAEPLAPGVLPAPGLAISALLATIAADQRLDVQRHRGLGYFPANADSPLDRSIRTLTELGLSEVTADHFIAETKRVFKISESSARSALLSLRAAGLFEPTGRATFTTTAPARDWLASNAVIDLVRIVHASTFPVGEVIDLIDEAKRVPTLATAVQQRFGVGSASALAIGRIIQLLHAAGVIREVGYARYASTALGRALAESLPLRAERGEDQRGAELGDDAESERPNPDEIAREVVEAGFRSDQPRRLEAAVSAALNLLGATAQDIGGPGNTDVLVEVGTQPTEKLVAIVDAKTAGQGVVNESAVKFDAIEDHRKKHGASLAAIVAPGFGDRLTKWAQDRKIALITTDLLAEVVRRHALTPLGRDDLRMLLTGRDEHVALRSSLDARARKADLVGAVITVLLREAQEDDPNVAAGLDIDGIYRAIRDQFQIKSDKDDLKAAVDVLSSPLVGGVVKRGSAYVAVEPIATVRARVASLAAVLDSAARTGA